VHDKIILKDQSVVIGELRKLNDNSVTVFDIESELELTLQLSNVSQITDRNGRQLYTAEPTIGASNLPTKNDSPFEGFFEGKGILKIEYVTKFVKDRDPEFWEKVVKGREIMKAFFVNGNARSFNYIRTNLENLVGSNYEIYFVLPVGRYSLLGKNTIAPGNFSDSEFLNTINSSGGEINQDLRLNIENFKVTEIRIEEKFTTINEKGLGNRIRGVYSGKLVKNNSQPTIYDDLSMFEMLYERKTDKYMISN
jgi:hypothetical protein